MTTNTGRQRPTFYHGTTSVLEIGKTLLPPLYTGNLREDWRKNNQDVVYMTTSLDSAKRYAKKACARYGGEPVIYQVNPIGWYHCRVNQEYIAEKAKILRKVEFGLV
jgi:hypothetical protein